MSEIARRRNAKQAERLGLVPVDQRPKPKDYRGWFHFYGAELRERDGDLCQLCLEPIDFDTPYKDQSTGQVNPGKASVDHIVPMALLEGLDHLVNYWLAHKGCNSAKGSRYAGRLDGTTDVRREAG